MSLRHSDVSFEQTRVIASSICPGSSRNMYGHLFCTSGRLSWVAVRVAYRKAALYQAGQEIYLAETALVPLIRKPLRCTLLGVAGSGVPLFAWLILLSGSSGAGILMSFWGRKHTSQSL